MPTAEELRGVVHHLERELVAVVRRLVDRLGRDPCEVAAAVRRQSALGARLELLHGAQRDVRARGVGLEAAVVAALAAAALGVDGGVPDLAGHVRGAVIEPAVEDDPAADAGADGEPDRVPAPLRGADPPLAQHGAVGVVVERRREPQAVVDDLAQRQVDPAEVRREQHDAALGVERARRADADADDLRARAPPAWSRRSPAGPWRPAGRARRPRPPRRGSARSLARAARSRPRRRCRRRGWCRRYQCPGRIARRSSTSLVAATAATTGLDRQLPHAAVMQQRTDLRPVRRAGPAGQRRVLQRRVARTPRAEAERRHRGAEDRHDRRADRGAEVQRRRIVGDQQRGPRDQRRRGSEIRARRPRCAPGPARARRSPPRAPVVRPADHDDRTVQRGRELGDSRASAWCPRSSPARARRTRPRARALPASRPRPRSPPGSSARETGGASVRSRLRPAPAAAPPRARAGRAESAWYK